MDQKLVAEEAHEHDSDSAAIETVANESESSLDMNTDAGKAKVGCDVDLSVTVADDTSDSSDALDKIEGAEEVSTDIEIEETIETSGKSES